MTTIENSREEIDVVNMLTSPLAIRVGTRIIGIIMMKNRIILTTMATTQKGKYF